MGRNPSNNYQQYSIEFKKGTEYRSFDVKLPCLSKVTFETTDPNIVKIQGAEEILTIPPSEVEKITKLFEDKGLHVLNIEPLTMQVPELCPSCQKRGVPKIEKKNTSDQRTRNWKYRKQTPKKTKPEEYWLVFNHNSRSKCRISQFMPLPYPSWKVQKNSNFPYTKFMLPYNYEWIKHQLGQ